MGKSEEEHWRDVTELRAALGEGDGTEESRRAMREVFCRQEEERLRKIRAKLGMPEPSVSRSPRGKILRLIFRRNR